MNWLERRETPCEQCGATQWVITPATNRGGHKIHPLVCDVCGYRSRVCAPKSVVEQHARKNAVEIKYAPPPDESKDCEVCGTKGAEQHHWAPGYLFGNEAEKWPKGWLCPSCHARWHRVISAQEKLA